MSITATVENDTRAACSSSTVNFSRFRFGAKLEVIEEMDDFARHTQEYRASRGLPYIDPATGELVKGHRGD